jgi:hypothetical protein
MGVATGTVDTEALLADERVVDMENEFRLLDPDESQFSTILNKLPSKPAIREKINWLEDQYFPRQVTVSGAQTNVETTIETSAGEGLYVRKGDLLRNMRTGEMLEADADGASGSFTCVRGIGDAAAAAMNDADELLIVANVSAQGADVGTLKVTTRTLGYNYSQIVRHPFGFTDTEIEIETYGSGDPMNEIAKKAVEHKRALEALHFFGARDFTSASPSSKGYMGGIAEYLTSNVFSSIGNLSRGGLDDKLRQIFQHGSRNKVIFSAPVPGQALSGLMADNWVRAQPDERVYGAKVSGFITGSFGDRVPVIVKREWGTFPTASNQYGSWMVVVDLDYVKKRPLRNRGTRLLRNRQGNGEDRTVHEYLTELSFEVSVEQAHGILKGITGPA